MRPEFLPEFHAPHTIRPDLKLLATGSPLLDHDQHLVAAIHEKLATQTQIAVRFSENTSGFSPAVEAAATALANSAGSPLASTSEGGALVALSHAELGLNIAKSRSGWAASFLNACTFSSAARESLTSRLSSEFDQGKRLWLALGYLLQEDMALMHWRGSAQGQALVADALHVSFPSGWLPSEKIGLSLRDIHAPVADGDLLLRASNPLGVNMVSRGPFERFVWTLTYDSCRARRPGTIVANDDRGGRPIFLRWERQTTVPLPLHQRALFLIRVYVEPLEAIVNTQDQLSHLKASLASMSPAVIAYKGLAPILNQLGVVQRAS